MGELSDDWKSWVVEAYVLRTPGDPECLKHHYITKSEKDEPQLTIDEEIAEINEQIRTSEGFDIDFSMFRCLFNYHLIDPDDRDFRKWPGTNGDLMNTLSQESIKRYNEERGTSFEFVKVVKANFHGCCGYMFLITFHVLDPVDNQEKPFQARVRYTTHYPTEYIFCRPKPDPNLISDESDESYEEDLSKAITDESSVEDLSNQRYRKRKGCEKTMIGVAGI